MILSDIDLLRELEEGELVVDPIEDIDQQVQPASIDLRLGTEFINFERANTPYLDPTDDQTIEEYTRTRTVKQDENIILQPGDFILASTKEHVEIPPHLVASVEGRSSLGRLAVIVHATAGWIDPGWKGQITLELSCLGPVPTALTPNMRIAQLVVEELKTECNRPYGEERGSKYQGQKGPEVSHIEEDKEMSE